MDRSARGIAKLPDAEPTYCENLTLWQPLVQAPFFQALAASIGRDERGLTIHGLVPGARALVLDLLVATTARPLLAVVPDDTALEALQGLISAAVSSRPLSTAPVRCSCATSSVRWMTWTTVCLDIPLGALTQPTRCARRLRLLRYR